MMSGRSQYATRWAVAVLWAAALVATPARAGIITPGSAEDFSILEKNGTFLAGLHATNLSPDDADVAVGFIGGPALMKGHKVGGGFVLLDGTLRIESQIPAGQVRAQVRIGYDVRRIRDRGLSKARLRLMRLRDGSDTWVRARRAVRADVRKRYLRDVRADGILGHFGIDRGRQIVWGVLDVTSSYAIGALARVPEPVSYALVIVGIALVSIGARGRRGRAAAAGAR